MCFQFLHFSNIFVGGWFSLQIDWDGVRNGKCKTGRKLRYWAHLSGNRVLLLWIWSFFSSEISLVNLAKLDSGLYESPTVMVGETKYNKKIGKNSCILKPSWAFLETKMFLQIHEMLSQTFIHHLFGNIYFRDCSWLRGAVLWCRIQMSFNKTQPTGWAENWKKYKIFRGQHTWRLKYPLKIHG
jgi:hypothetical protein